MPLKYNFFEVTVNFKSIEWWNNKRDRLPTGEPLAKKLKINPCAVKKRPAKKFKRSLVQYNSESFRIIVSIEKHIALYDLYIIANSLLNHYGTTTDNNIRRKIQSVKYRRKLLSHLDYIFQYVLEADVIYVLWGPIERYIKRRLGIVYEDEKTAVISPRTSAPLPQQNKCASRICLKHADSRNSDGNVAKYAACIRAK